MSTVATTVPSTGGAVTFWRLDAVTSVSTLKEGLEELGLGSLAPSPRTRLAVLKDAIDEVCRKSKTKTIFVPLDDRSGFAAIEHGAAGVTPGTPWGQVKYVIRFENDMLVMSPNDSSILYEVEYVYKLGLDIITAPMAGKCLVDVCKALGGTSLRPAGGIYWLHESKLDAWEYVAKAFNRAARKESVVYLIRHKLDFDSVRAVYDGILTETAAELERIKKEVMKGDLGEAALLSRETLCKSLAQRLTEYEQILGVSMGETKRLAEEMTDMQAWAVLQQQVLEPAHAV